MCVLALAWQAHPRWRLVLVANRDERHDRLAAPLARWSEADHVLAGRDLASGGTWLGLSETGRLAVVTNRHVEAPADPGALSRGGLLRNILTGEDHSSPPPSLRFNPFNLITIAGTRAAFTTNFPQPDTRPLAPGIHGLSNATLNTAWPKVVRLKQRLAEWLGRADAQTDGLLDALADDETTTTAPHPVGSPIFIRDRVFGTRCSTVVTVDTAGEGLIVERRFTAEAKLAGETSLRFRWADLQA
ncbi:NRDE family protein [Caulobacter radicis]|uniref:NRDE family protein n=1 Tax=Caulobacter radicis TaxID=2172650 RepID=A0A2T9JX83_9CAUL|nr:NRDE family protein [Caulobacter radicis]PVM88320.1 hypothetical protein DDF65_02105 [Caulobacter radicis]